MMVEAKCGWQNRTGNSSVFKKEQCWRSFLAYQSLNRSRTPRSSDGPQLISLCELHGFPVIPQHSLAGRTAICLATWILHASTDMAPQDSLSAYGSASLASGIVESHARIYLSCLLNDGAALWNSYSLSGQNHSILHKMLLHKHHMFSRVSVSICTLTQILHAYQNQCGSVFSISCNFALSAPKVIES